LVTVLGASPAGIEQDIASDGGNDWNLISESILHGVFMGFVYLRMFADIC